MTRKTRERALPSGFRAGSVISESFRVIFTLVRVAARYVHASPQWHTKTWPFHPATTTSQIMHI